MAMSRRETMARTVTTRSKSQVKKKGKKQKSKKQTKTSPSKAKGRPNLSPNIKTYPGKARQKVIEAITLSPTPPPSQHNSPHSSPPRCASPCSEDELFRLIKIEVSPVKRSVKNKQPVMVKNEFYPDKLKRNAVEKKNWLLHRYALKNISSRRKVMCPKKGYTGNIVSNDLTPESMQDLDQTDKRNEIEFDEELGDEDFLEILNCESPVWWEEAPDDTYDEEPIDRELIEAARKMDSPLPLEEDMELRTNEIHRSNDTFFKKKSKLENVLGNMKIKKEIARDNITKKARISESSDGDVLDMSLNDYEMLKTLEKIVIPIENTETPCADDNDSIKDDEKFDLGTAGSSKDDENEVYEVEMHTQEDSDEVMYVVTTLLRKDKVTDKDTDKKDMSICDEDCKVVEQNETVGKDAVEKKPDKNTRNVISTEKRLERFARNYETKYKENDIDKTEILKVNTQGRIDRDGLKTYGRCGN